MKLIRYDMGWSQADNGWIVVYAHSLDEAEMKFEAGEYQIEKDEIPERNME